MVRKFLATTAAFMASLQLACGATQLPEWARKATKDGVSVEEAQRFYAGATRTRFDSIHALQVEYNAPDGKSYLWYAGNTAIVRGAWKVEVGTTPSGREAARVCYRYDQNSYDPADGAAGGDWKCLWAVVGVMMTEEHVAGDVFRLASSERPPFVLPRGDLTIRELQAGGSARVVAVKDNRESTTVTTGHIPPFDPSLCIAASPAGEARANCMRNMLRARRSAIRAEHDRHAAKEKKHCEMLARMNASRLANNLPVIHDTGCER